MMFSSLGFWGATNDSISASFSNSVLSNTKWISVWHDPMFAHVQKVYDGGILTTSVWSRALSTGGSAVLMVNETNTQPMSVQFSALGMSPALTTFDVFDCWSNQDLGNFNGGFTNSIPMQDCGLYVVTPVSTGGGGGSSALPASTNSIWNLTNTANTFSGNGGGLTNLQPANVTANVKATMHQVGAQSISGDTVLAFDTIDSDPGNICNATTHTITIPSTGRYLITYGVVFTVTGGDTSYGYVTGTVGFLNQPINASGAVGSGLMLKESVVVDYTASTVVTVHVATTTGAIYVGSGNFYPTVTITKLSN
jgi:hypothetical protein